MRTMGIPPAECDRSDGQLYLDPLKFVQNDQQVWFEFYRGRSLDEGVDAVFSGVRQTGDAARGRYAMTDKALSSARDFDHAAVHV